MHNKTPKHIAVIMDGNGRWAERKGHVRTYGHVQAGASITDTIHGCLEQNVPYLTLYCASIENFQRPKGEIDAIINVMSLYVQSKLQWFIDCDIKILCIGDVSVLENTTYGLFQECLKKTANNKGLQLCVAINYSARWEILHATRSIAKAVEQGEIAADEVDEAYFSTFLETHDMPDPELLIRTGGEYRVSNFLLWQIAYTELYITDLLWPDFRKEHLRQAISVYQRRERRFGKLGMQHASA